MRIKEIPALKAGFFYGRRSYKPMGNKIYIDRG